MQTWITEQINAANATNVLATLDYKIGAISLVTVLMSTRMVPGTITPVGPYVAAGQFEIRENIASLLSWLNAQENGVAAPAAPTLSTVVAGALTGQGTLSVKVTLVTPYGETAASANSSEAVPDDSELVVTSPALDAGHLATGWNVYVGAAGAEKKQNTTPIAIGTNYTLTAAVQTGTAAAPATNATGAKYLRHLSLVDNFQSKIATVVVSN